jgi:RecA-family ATPase
MMAAELLTGIAPLAAILRLAEHYPVFPCRRHAEAVEINGRTVTLKPKSPLVKRGFMDATQDEVQIRAWWQRWPEAYVGVPTGQRTGLVVVDYDHGKASSTTHEWIGEHSNELLATRIHGTLSGGKHYLYRNPTGKKYRSSVGLTMGGVKHDGLDTRAEGGYIIWWPLHGGLREGTIAPLPAGLIDEYLIEDRPLPALPSVSPEKWARDRPRVVAALAYVDPTSYDVWQRVGAALHLASGGSDDGFDLWHAWSAGGITGETPRNYAGIEDCRVRWGSFHHGGDRVATLGTIFHHAKASGWGAPQERPSHDLPPIEAYADDEGAATATTPETHCVIAPGRRMRWAELQDREPPQRTWLIDHWLTYGITLLAGRGGIGKSLIAQTVGTALAIGRPFVDHIATPQTVLMWACEDDHDEIWRRQVAINRLLGCTMADIEGRFIVESRVGAANGMWVQAFGSLTAGPALKEWHEQINDLKADVAILDNIAHAFGGTENDRHHVTSFVNGLSSATERPLATILLGHVAKAQGSEFAGSTAWENAARMRWLFDVRMPDTKPDDGQEPEPDVRYLAKRKANYSTNDWRRYTYRNGVFVQDGATGVAVNYAAQSRKDDARRCVLSALRKLAASGLTAAASTASPDYLPKLVLRMKLGEDYSQRELAEAMAALLVAGRLKNDVVGQYANRTPKKGLVEVPL